MTLVLATQVGRDPLDPFGIASEQSFPMSKHDLLLTLPSGALKEVADWLASTRERFRDRAGWVKAVYAEEIARAIGVRETATLVREVQADSDYYYAESLLIQLFGLPPKADMLNCSRAQLRGFVEQMEDQGRVDAPWRSWSVGDLRDYLMRKLSAREIAELVGLELSYDRAEDATVEPSAAPKSQTRSSLPPSTAELQGRRLVPIEAALLRADTDASPVQAASSPLIETLDHLRRYLVHDLKRDLESMDDLGSNEGRFQHKIVAALESRISREPFYIEERQHLSDLDQFPDVMIQHARGNTAFEIKRAGNLNALLKDAEKLKGYLRVKKIKVTFGVLIYSSPFAVPDELARAMRDDRLHVVRVHWSRSR
ncbi:MAG: hypothetical protein JWP01_3434 [Myxococcales bacterium]|nr:hypothetical protein [Myxococcales bacterium]